VLGAARRRFAGADGPLFEVYAANTTGWEPIEGERDRSPDHILRATAGKHPKLKTNVYRTTTKDFVSYTALEIVVEFDTGGDPYP
jgi:hypothetical protein